MSKELEKELMQLDLYGIIKVDMQAEEKVIKKAYRKEALLCHPDKNPDNPDAAYQFNRLKKILEILLDPGARRAYDRLLKSRKAAALRAKESNSKSRKLKEELEEREKSARNFISSVSRPQLSEEEKLRRELKRLEEEGEKLIAEELEKVNKQAEQDLEKAFGNFGVKKTEKKPGEGFRVKAKWVSTEDWPGYTEDDIRNLFYKWGEIFAIAMKQKGDKGAALIEYKDENGANMASQFEIGLPGKPVKVSLLKTGEEKCEKKSKPLNSGLASPWDYESVAVMNARRERERQKLIEELTKEEMR